MQPDARISSYTAASSLPLKLLKNHEVISGAGVNRVFPIHIQFIPTERCNLKCAWCSCANDSRKTTIAIERVRKMVDTLCRWSTQAVTVTGGGEPLLHPQLPVMLKMFSDAKWQIGLVTNAYLFDKLDAEALCRLRWCRISCSDDRGLETGFLGEIVSGAVDRAPMVDWAFSYVVTRQFNAKRLAKYLEFANEHKFTHVRVVTDLLDVEAVPPMTEVRDSIRLLGVDDSLAIYQDRRTYCRGTNPCYISLLKPVISADGKVFACCGIQYVEEPPTLNLPDSMAMGTIDDLDEILAKQRFFDGRVCKRCYYSSYNEFLGAFFAPIKHAEFV